MTWPVQGGVPMTTMLFACSHPSRDGTIASRPAVESIRTGSGSAGGSRGVHGARWVPAGPARGGYGVPSSSAMTGYLHLGLLRVGRSGRGPEPGTGLWPVRLLPEEFDRGFAGDGPCPAGAGRGGGAALMDAG